MLETARLNGYAEATIQGLQADGIKLTPTEIVTINALCWEVETPESRRMLARGIPIDIGGVYLWPQTLYASEWFDRVGSKLRPKWLATAALAYSMAYSYTAGPELEFMGLKAILAVSRWYFSLRCRTAELMVAISQVLGQDEEYEQPAEESRRSSKEFRKIRILRTCQII